MKIELPLNMRAEPVLILVHQTKVLLLLPRSDGNELSVSTVSPKLTFQVRHANVPTIKKILKSTVIQISEIKIV